MIRECRNPIAKGDLGWIFAVTAVSYTHLELKEANRGLKPMLVITLAATLANVALFILQILGILGI